MMKYKNESRYVEIVYENRAMRYISGKNFNMNRKPKIHSRADNFINPSRNIIFHCQRVGKTFHLLEA